MMHPRSLRPALVIAALSAAGPARASVVTPLGVADLSARADVIALGRVVSQESRFTSDGGAIYTSVTIEVSRGVKGARDGDTVVLRREGGEVGGLGMKVVGAARFSVGEEVLVFLEKRGAALWTVGMAQGKLRVVTESGRRMALRDTAGIEGAAIAEPALHDLDELLRALAAEVAKAPRTAVPARSHR